MKHILNKLGPAAPAANAQRYFPFEELETEAEQQYIVLELLWVGENELLFEVMMTAADGGLDLERLVRTTNSSLESIGKMYTL